jgi:protein TonB
MGRLLHGAGVSAGAVGLTLACFLVLPLMQTISSAPAHDLLLQNIDTAELPPPPAPLEEPDEPDPEPEEPPPELAEEIAPLDLAQLELALNPSLAADGLAGDFAVKLNVGARDGAGGDVDALFSLADLDQKPRPIYQSSPALDAQVRKKAPGTVYVLFVVDQNGRVENPVVQGSTDPVFEKPALAAVKQWKFEPGKRKGQPVRFRMRVPVIFPQSS